MWARSYKSIARAAQKTTFEARHFRDEDAPNKFHIIRGFWCKPPQALLVCFLS